MQISIHDNGLFDMFYAFDQHIIRVFPQCEKPISKMRKPTKNERVSKKNRFISLFSSKKREILSFCYHPQVLCYQGKMFIANVNLHLPINKNCLHSLIILHYSFITISIADRCSALNKNYSGNPKEYLILNFQILAICVI